MTDSLQKLFIETVKDTYSAEKQFLGGMRKASKAAQSDELRKAVETHMTETQGHIERLQKVAELVGTSPSGKLCKAAQGLVEEAEEGLEDAEAGPVRDAAIIEILQKCEHYEISGYGTLISWAEQLGEQEVMTILDQTLQEELHADETLTKVAKESVNQQALAGV